MSNRFEGMPMPSSNEDASGDAAARAEAKRYSDEKLKQIQEHIRQEEDIRDRFREARVEYDRITTKIETVARDWKEYLVKVHEAKDGLMETDEGMDTLQLGVDNLERYSKLHSILIEHEKLLDEKFDRLKEEFAREQELLDQLFLELKGGIAEKN